MNKKNLKFNLKFVVNKKSKKLYFIVNLVKYESINFK